MILTETRVARLAMATRFEIVIHGRNPAHDRALAEEALDEIERLESQLSLFKPASSVSRINSRAFHEPVRVDASVFQLLTRAKSIHAETSGAFDITIGPLMHRWGMRGEIEKLPTPQEILTLLDQLGSNHLELDPSNYTVRFKRPGIQVDLGAIGKGWAIEKAVQILLDCEVQSALIHGGTSSIHAIGSPPGMDSWRVALELPLPTEPSGTGTTPIPTVISLRNQSLSVSAVWGKTITDPSSGKTLGHVMDPRTGYPTTGAALAAVICDSATDADALSTALLTLGKGGIEHLSPLRPSLGMLVVEQAGKDQPLQVHRHNIPDFPGLA